MILVIIFIFMILLGIVGIRASYNSKFDGFEMPGTILTIFGSLLLIASTIIIIGSHACADYTIQKNKIEYEGLCKRYEIIKSEYEDVSKSDVIADIAGWNTEVYSTKYWTENPWTNWFNPKKISDNLDYIPLKEGEE